MRPTLSRRMRYGPRAGVLLALLVAAGCSSEEKLVPVQGTVKLGEEPLKTGNITFHPDGSKGNNATQEAVGTIENGSYKLNYKGKDGAPAGAYKVTIKSSVPANPKDEYSVPKSIIAEKYGIVDASGFYADVKEGGGPYDFKVTK